MREVRLLNVLCTGAGSSESNARQRLFVCGHQGQPVAADALNAFLRLAGHF